MSEPSSRLRRTSLLTTEVLDRSRVLDTLVNNLEGMVYRCLQDEHWTMVFVSQGCMGLTGYSPAEIVEQGLISWEALTHPGDRAMVRAEVEAAVGAGRRFSLQYRIVTRSGLVKWVLERGMRVFDEQGDPVIEGFIEDVTARHAMLQAIEEAESRYRSIFEHASEGIFQTTADGRYLAANPALARIYGYESPEALIAKLSDIGRTLYVDPARRDEFQRLMRTRGQVLNFESEVYRRDGTRIWISENAHVVRGVRGELVCYEGTVQDVSERRHYQAQLERQASHDLLTGLPNRILLGERIGQGIARAREMGYFLALVYVDLDNFKFVNDSLGHQAGDDLLKAVAARFSACMRRGDTVARIGGDEFVLLLNDHYHVGTVAAVLERVLREIGRPIALGGREFQVGASLGVALFPSDGSDAQGLLRCADVAMYAAKDRGRNNFQFYTPGLNRAADERLNLEAAMRGALERDEFVVRYQPKFDASRRIVGVEALARWDCPGVDEIEPARFIPIAESAGLILPLTVAVVRHAAEAAAAWNRDRRAPLRLAVNLSPRLFLDDGIVALLSGLVREAGLPAQLVELEITESLCLGDGDRAVAILRRLKAQGFRLAIDDFGTGYSSLSYLRRFPADIVKIDRSLVTGIEREEEVAMIARAAISLGRSLRKTVVAEGVENEAQFEFLRAGGCDEFQGFLLSRPLARDEMTALLDGAPEASA